MRRHVTENSGDLHAHQDERLMDRSGSFRKPCVTMDTRSSRYRRTDKFAKCRPLRSLQGADNLLHI